MNTAPTLRDPDSFYERLIDAQRGLDAEASQLVLMRLVFLLANQIGDDTVIAQCIEAARRPVNRP